MLTYFSDTYIRHRTHDDDIKWKHFPRYWPFVRRIHRSPVNSPHKGQCRRALMFSLICVWINGWVNNREAGYLRRYRAHYDVIVMHVFAPVFCCYRREPSLNLMPSSKVADEISWNLVAHRVFINYKYLGTRWTNTYFVLKGAVGVVDKSMLHRE